MDGIQASRMKEILVFWGKYEAFGVARVEG